jgi:hypothetical protein
MSFSHDLLEHAHYLAYRENVPSALHTVAKNFIQLQQHRLTADYEIAKEPPVDWSAPR